MAIIAVCIFNKHENRHCNNRLTVTVIAVVEPTMTLINVATVMVPVFAVLFCLFLQGAIVVVCFKSFCVDISLIFLSRFELAIALWYMECHI